MRNIIFIVFQSYRVPFVFAARNLVTRCQIFTYIFRTLSRSLLMYSNIHLSLNFLSSDSCRSCRTIILIIEKIDNNKSEIDSHFLKSYPPYSFSIASTPLFHRTAKQIGYFQLRRVRLLNLFETKARGNERDCR